ncbi:hypothetical protein LTS15_009535 [Exophiala xenobiotica]|nr:hypothetical protein LTS15_009535 [Exophiala xenobiotica]
MPSDPSLLASAVPRIGVAVFIVHPSPTPSDPSGWKLLLGQRLGSHGSGTWALPGGHLEMGEEFEDCAAREILEETGLVVEKVAFLTATNDVLHQRDSGKHYVTIWMSARVAPDANVVALAQPEESARETGSDNVDLTTSGSKKDPKMPEARLMEPQSCAGWEWVSWEQLEEWGLAQIERENLQIEREKRGMSTSTEESDRSSEISCGPRNDGARTLFSPMINLLVEREGIVSRLSSACAN